jgi:acetylornithine deacetylase
MTRIPTGDAVALLSALVRTDSRNPGLVEGAPGEGAAAHLLADVLRDWRFRVELLETIPGRPNVVARIGKAGAKRSIMFNGHLDTVGVESMSHSPFVPEVRDGRLYGRGSCDMKAGVAAMCAAAVQAAASDLAGEIIVAAVIDEEFRSAGTQALVAAGVRADAAIVTEPTSLEIHPAHRGFTWAEFTLRGRAAHGSRYELGVDAIAHAGVLLDELARLERETLVHVTHPLLGRASLHASFISGGSGWSTYPDHCSLKIERRILPGETPDDVMAQFQAVVARAAQRVSGMEVRVDHVFSQRPSDVSTSAPIVESLRNALRACGEQPRVAGMSAWTDAALLNDAGIPAICFGPGDIMLAHSAEEWVPLDEVEHATRILSRLALDWCAAYD